MDVVTARELKPAASDLVTLHDIIKNMGYEQINYDELTPIDRINFKYLEINRRLHDVASQVSTITYIDAESFCEKQSVNYHDIYIALLVRVNSETKQYCLPKKLKLTIARSGV